MQFDLVKVNEIFLVVSVVQAIRPATFMFFKGVFNYATGFHDIKSILQNLKRKTKIDPDQDGYIPQKFKGKVKLLNVHFNYPSRPEIKVLNGLNLSVSEGERVALVGQAGCGKSTIIKLLQRYYDVNRGAVFVGGYNVKKLSLPYLRGSLGLVEQEPVLLNQSVTYNIQTGKSSEIFKIHNANLKKRDPLIHTEKVEKGYAKKVFKNEFPFSGVENVAEKAYVSRFAPTLQDGYDTLVGLGGNNLSGGQKQRVAIARTMYKEPEILLLDEATSVPRLGTYFELKTIFVFFVLTKLNEQLK